MLDVPDVAADAALHLVEGLGLAAVAGDLAPAGDAWLDVVADHVFVDQVGVFLRVLEHVGAGSHDAHLPEQHVDELRELVDAGLAQYLAPLGHAGVVPRGLQAVGLGVDLHAAELQAGELPAVDAGALLAEKDGPGHGEFGDYRHHDEHGDKQCAEEEQRERYVERPLDGAVARPAERLLVEAQAGHAAHHAEVHSMIEVVAHIRHAVKPYQMIFAVMDDGQNLVFLFRGKATIQVADVVAMFLQIGNHLRRRAQVRALFREFTVRLIVKIAANPIPDGWISRQFMIQFNVVFRTSHKHYSIAVSCPFPIILDKGAYAQPEAGDGKHHGQQEAYIDTPRRHGKVSPD